MEERIIYDKTLLKSDATVSSNACEWKNVEGVLPPSGSTSENPDDYYFTVNGVKYQCDYFLHGETKFKASYRVSGHDAIMLEYIIATGLSNIKIRTDDIEVLDSNDFTLTERMPEKNNKKVIINIEGNVAYVTYQDGHYTLEEVE